MSAAKVWINLPEGATHISASGVFYRKVELTNVWLYWDTYTKHWMRSYSTLKLEVL